MSAIAILETTVKLHSTTSERLLTECQKKFLLPRQVVAVSLGEDLKEPVVFKIPEYYSCIRPPSAFFMEPDLYIRRQRHQKKLYLLILSQIINGVSPEQFAAVAKALHGTKRVYLGASRAAVELTGRNNQAAHIPDTEWWASVNVSGEKKQQILTGLMRALKFSPDYARMISRVPNHRKLQVQGITYKTC